MMRKLMSPGADDVVTPAASAYTHDTPQASYLPQTQFGKKNASPGDDVGEDAEP